MPPYRTRAEAAYQALIDDPYSDEDGEMARRVLPNQQEFIGRAEEQFARRDSRALGRAQRRLDAARNQESLRARGRASQGLQGTYAQGLRPASGLEMGDVMGGIQTFRPSGQGALMAGARTGQSIGDYLAGGGMSPGGGGGRVGSTASLTPGADPTDRFANYSNEELLALGPSALSLLSPTRLASFGNDVFMKNPTLLAKLDPASRASRLTSMPNEFFVQNPGYYKELTQQQITGRGFGAGVAPQAGGIPTYPQLQKTGIVPGRVQAALSPLVAGKQQTSPYYVNKEAAQIRAPSAQTYYGGMNATDREALGATYEGVGLYPEDILSQQNLQGSGRPQQFNVRRRPTAEVRY